MRNDDIGGINSRLIGVGRDILRNRQAFEKLVKRSQFVGRKRDKVMGELDSRGKIKMRRARIIRWWGARGAGRRDYNVGAF